MKKCSVDLITGFLSSGKTSFINHILDDFSKEEVLVIQCEYGQEELINCRKNINVKKFYSMDELKELKVYLKIGMIVNLIDMTTFNMFLKNIPSMIIPNISLSNLIVLNKCNEISENALKEYKDMIERFNHNAHIVNCIGKEGTNMNFNKERLINRMMG